jgi:GDPmannose 4,6-dehydratase
VLHGTGSTVWGATRAGVLPTDMGFVHLTSPIDLRDQASLDRIVEAVRPDEVYHLAAQSSVAVSWDDPVGTGDITGLGTVRILEAVRRHAPRARVFIASSSEIFGEPEHAPQTEQTPIRPITPYGAAKAYAMHVAHAYRQRHGLFVSIGILYNHESPRRPATFVTRKITQGVAAIVRGEQTELRLGNLEARRDWGYAEDYVRAMHLMLQQEQPGDYVVATGQTHSVREFCEIAFGAVGLDYRRFVVSDPMFWRPDTVVPLVGNSARARTKLGWEHTTPFSDLVKMLVDSDRVSVDSPH